MTKNIDPPDSNESEVPEPEPEEPRLSQLPWHLGTGVSDKSTFDPIFHLPPPLLNQLAVVRPIAGQGSPCTFRAVTPCHLPASPTNHLLHQFENCPQRRF